MPQHIKGLVLDVCADDTGAYIELLLDNKRLVSSFRWKLLTRR